MSDIELGFNGRINFKKIDTRNGINEPFGCVIAHCVQILSFFMVTIFINCHISYKQFFMILNSYYNKDTIEKTIEKETVQIKSILYEKYLVKYFVILNIFLSNTQ